MPATPPDSPARRGRPVSAAGAAERRQKLCHAALVVAMRDGVAATSTRAVAEAAGLTQAMVHYEFASKDGLLLAVLEHIHGEVREALAASLDGSRGLGPAIRRLADAYWTHVLATPALQRVQYELTLHALTLDGGAAIARAQYEGYVQVLTAALAAVARKPVKEALLRDVAGACVALMDGLILQWLATRDTPACERRLALAVRTLQQAFGPLDE